MSPNLDPLHLGPDVVQMLIPHRRPLLMVDAVTGYRRAPRLELTAFRLVTANEEVFAGHFPRLHLWPGVYTIEGLGQCVNVVTVVEGLQRGFEEQGARAEDALGLLQNEDLGFRLDPGYRAELSKLLRDGFARVVARFGVSAAVDVKLLEPVFAGQRIDYHVARTHVIGDVERFEVAAWVAGRPVARGFMTSARRTFMPGLTQGGAP
jgi:3-hydroxyacyl-[acyl-carrier-protein] dehydratase